MRMRLRVEKVRAVVDCQCLAGALLERNRDGGTPDSGRLASSIRWTIGGWTWTVPNSHPLKISRVCFLHAKLYVLADTYAIFDLMKMGKQKLMYVLDWFKLYKESIGHVAALIGYLYKNMELPPTLNTKQTNKLYKNIRTTDAIREVLVTYGATFIEDVIEGTNCKPEP
ncbi:Uu.00g116060.m01.CDS01 [Anthostomella pinea]|uniref:Uu.00g116060.m01.CDS01 n=1 Tax=Anthostomella pinea TaxID=933095 RepID=A0AAI8VG11_9PEZI|nr:Uu.00g116060.m01.CDS01 [Anthostomella pinea]